MAVDRVGAGSSSSAAAAAAAAAAAEAARRAEEARRRAEAARKAAEAARKAAEEARRKAAEARRHASDWKKQVTAAQKQEAQVTPGEKPTAKKATANAKARAEAAEKKAIAAEKKAQAAEEQVAEIAKKAEDEMRSANALAKAGKKAEPYSAKDLERTQLTSNEVKSAFDGASARRKDDLAKVLGVDASAKPEAVAKELAADREYAKLAGDPKNRQALEQLGIQDGKDLVKLGDRLEGQMNRGDRTRRADDVDLSKVKDKDALAKILQGAGSTRSGEAQKTMSNETFAKLVANGVAPQDAKASFKALEDLGYSPQDLQDMARLSTNHADFKKVMASVATMSDPSKSVAEKIAAGFELADTAKNFIPPEKLQGLLDKALSGLPAAKAVTEAIGKFTDPNASGLDKAKAGFELAKELKDLAGGTFPQLAEKLRRLDGPARAIGAALTLLDPQAKLSDKAIATAQLAAELPDLKGGLTRLKDVFKKAGVQGADEVLAQGEDLAALARRGIDPAVAGQLTPQQLDELTAVAAKLDGDAAKNLAGAMKGLDKAGVETLLAVGKEMSGEALSKVLADPDAAANLAKTLPKLDATSAAAFAKLAKDMDGDGMKVLLKFAAVAPRDVFNHGVRTLAPILEKGGGKLLGKALSALDAIVGKLGVKLTGDVAMKVFKSLVKIAPVAGAVPNAIDAFNYGKEAVELRGKNKDLGFLATVGAGLNTADAAFGLIADATGIGVLADIGGSIAFSVAELALDLGFSSEKAKMLKDPKGYQAPDWVKAANLAGAVLTAPAGVTALVGYYGPTEAGELALWAAGKGGSLAKKAWDALAQIGGPVAEYAGKAVEQLEALGEDGVEALEYIATHPGKLGQEAVKLAVGGLKNLGESGLEAARDALGGLKNLGGDVADLAGNALEGLGNFAVSVGEKLNPFD